MTVMQKMCFMEYVVTMSVLLYLCQGATSVDIPLHIGGYFINQGYGVWAEGSLTAAHMAFDDVNSRDGILSGYRLELNATNTQGNSGIAMRELIDQLHTPPTKIMILGPTKEPESLAVAETSRYWNLVQMGFSTIAPDLSDKERFPLYYRTRMPQMSLNPARLALMDLFGWHRAAIFHATSLKADAIYYMDNMISHNKTVLAVEDWTGSIHDEIKRLKEIGARIFYVFIFNGDDQLRQIFCEAYKQGLYPPRYAWVLSSAGRGHEWWNVTKAAEEEAITCTTEEIMVAANGNIVVNDTMWNAVGGQTTFGIHTNDFRSHYLNATSELGLYPAYFAPLVYDAVWSIAYALNTTRQRLPPGKALEDFTYEDSEMAEIIAAAVADTSFIGVSGPVAFNSVGDRIGTVMIYQLVDTQYVLRGTYHDSMFDWKSEITWKDGVVPPDRQLEDREIIAISYSLFYCMCALTVLGIAFALYLVVFNVMNKEKRTIRMSSPKLNGAIILGAVLAYMANVLFGFDGYMAGGDFTVVLCQLRVWLLCLGFTIGFGAMFSKTWRIHKIFTNKKMKSIRIKDIHLLGIVFVLISIDVIILLLWVCLDPLRHEEKELPSRLSTDGPLDINIIPVIAECSSSYLTIWLGLLYGYKGVILLFGCFLAWETRNVRYTQLNDSRLIGFAVYNVMVLCLLGVPTSFIVPAEQADVKYAISGLSIVLCTTTTLCIVFVPKVLDLRNSDVAPEITGMTLQTGANGSRVETVVTCAFKHTSGSCFKAEEELKKLRDLYREAHDAVITYRRQIAGQEDTSHHA